MPSPQNWLFDLNEMPDLPGPGLGMDWGVMFEDDDDIGGKSWQEVMTWIRGKYGKA